MFFKSKTKPLFFIHIPKTAGTSFRSGLIKAVSGKSLLDYGEDSKNTSALIKEIIYGDHKSFPCLYNLMIEKNYNLLSGHVGYAKYRGLFNLENIVTFLRDPRSQVISHFKHYVKYLGYEKSFEDFIEDKRFCNLQYRHLQGAILESVGFLGIVEQYDKSVELFNAQFKMNVRLKSLNVNDDSFLVDMTPELEERIRKNNENDFELYDRARRLFSDRYKAYTEGKKWAYCWGRYSDSSNLSVYGWYRDDCKAVSVDMETTKRTLNNISLSEFSFESKGNGGANLGYVCHKFRFSKSEAIVSIKVSETQQEIPIYK